MKWLTSCPFIQKALCFNDDSFDSKSIKQPCIWHNNGWYMQQYDGCSMVVRTIWTIPILYQTDSHFVGKASAISQPTSPTQPSIPLRSLNQKKPIQVGALVADANDRTCGERRDLPPTWLSTTASGLEYALAAGSMAKEWEMRPALDAVLWESLLAMRIICTHLHVKYCSHRRSCGRCDHLFMSYISCHNSEKTWNNCEWNNCCPHYVLHCILLQYAWSQNLEQSLIISSDNN